MSVEESYNFRRVSDLITTSGVVDADRLANLRAEGYEAVINLLPDSHDHAVHDEAQILEAQGVDYVYIPVDFAAPNSDDFEAFVEAMDARVGQKIHVHCAANFRVSAFYGLYASRTGQWTAQDADEFMHTVWDPTRYPGWMELIIAERSRTDT